MTSPSGSFDTAAVFSDLRDTAPDIVPRRCKPAPALAFYETFVGFGNVSGAPGPPGQNTTPQGDRMPVLLVEAPSDPAEQKELYNPGGHGFELCAIISSIWPRATYFAFGPKVDEVNPLKCTVGDAGGDRTVIEVGFAGRAIIVIRHADYSTKIE